MTEPAAPTALTPEERRTLFFDHFRKISTARDKLKIAQEEVKKARKLAKADGIVLADVDYAFRCAETDDEGILVDELKRRIEIANWMALLPPGTQFDLFDMSRVPAEDLAYAKGRIASSIGKSADPSVDGYDTSTPQGQAWLKGHADDQEIRRRSLKEAMTKKLAEKGPPDNVVKAAQRKRKKEGEGGSGEHEPFPRDASTTVQ